MDSKLGPCFDGHIKDVVGNKFVTTIDLEEIFCDVLKISRSSLYINQDVTISKDKLIVIKEYIQRRECGEPLAYILGRKGFWNIEVAVNKHVLVPRPETETLVEVVLGYITDQKLKILDAGTGSGAIALALASEKKNLAVYALDNSRKALKVAWKNSENLKIKIRLIQCNWLESIAYNSFDLIVSNPPYVEWDDERLQSDGVSYEPLSSLVADQNGMQDIERLIREGFHCLRDDGLLFVEHSPEQADLVRKIFQESNFINLTVYKDLNGDNRISSGKKV
jgi:release factor glutamine methyltransferase